MHLCCLWNYREDGLQVFLVTPIHLLNSAAGMSMYVPHPTSQSNGLLIAVFISSDAGTLSYSHGHTLDYFSSEMSHCQPPPI